jgi:hypothetical protein
MCTEKSRIIRRSGRINPPDPVSFLQVMLKRASQKMKYKKTPLTAIIQRDNPEFTHHIPVQHVINKILVFSGSDLNLFITWTDSQPGA